MSRASKPSKQRERPARVMLRLEGEAFNDQTATLPGAKEGKKTKERRFTLER